MMSKRYADHYKERKDKINNSSHSNVVFGNLTQLLNEVTFLFAFYLGKFCSEVCSEEVK